MKGAVVFSAVACAASANAFVLTPPTSAALVQRVPALRMVGQKHVGAGGMADTRDPTPYVDPDSRKSITKAPSFEEYMREQAAKRGGGGGSPAPSSSQAPPPPAQAQSGGQKPLSPFEEYMRSRNGGGGSSAGSSAPSGSSTPPGHKGAGGMADTRDPEPYVDPQDRRKSISKAPSFEEYLAQQAAKKGGGGGSPAPSSSAQAPPTQSGGQKPLSPFEEYMQKRNGGGGSPAPSSSQAPPPPPPAQAQAGGQKPLSPFEEYMRSRNGGGGSSSAPSSAPSSASSSPSGYKTPPGHKGAGGMADTRDPEPYVDPADSRKSITKAPSFEEYMREQAAKRARGGN